jgi:hypothetical protein
MLSEGVRGNRVASAATREVDCMCFFVDRALGMSRRLICLTLLLGRAAFAQSGSPSATPAGSQNLDAEIRSLTESLEQTRSELAQSRTEIKQLRTALEEVISRVNGLAPTPAAGEKAVTVESSKNAPTPKSDEGQGQANISQDDWDILKARIEEQRQVKVESSSRYRLKLSGLVLFNASAITGQVNNLDLPDVAVPPAAGSSSGSLSASLRQSIVGLTGFGPDVFGARTSGDLQMDFFGGLPSGYAGNSSGIARLRLARIRMDWKNTSLVVGLDNPFFSPNSPTTYMSVAEPGLASAGNLWSWTPTIWLEERFDGALSPFKIQAGLLDVAPASNYTVNVTERTPNPAESSRQPTYALRISAGTKSEDRPATIGVGALYSPQEYFGGYTIAGWAGTLDWKFSLLPRTELNGEFFTGRGLDGLGGLPLSPVTPQNPAYFAMFAAPEIANLGSIGGWSQFKIKVNARNEFNVAAGTGGRNSAQLRQASLSDAFLLTVPARNEMLFANYIFKPRSDLLFSAEYRRLRTYYPNGSPSVAQQVGLAVGFLF